MVSRSCGLPLDEQDNLPSQILYGYDWELAGGQQIALARMDPEGWREGRHDPGSVRFDGRTCPPTCGRPLLRLDPAAKKKSHGVGSVIKVSWRVRQAWYKLLHRDMGRYARPGRVPEPQLAGPGFPRPMINLIGDADIAILKSRLLDSGLSVSRRWYRPRRRRPQASQRGGGGASGAQVAWSRRRTGQRARNPLSAVLPDPRRVQQGFSRGWWSQGFTRRPDRSGWYSSSRAGRETPDKTSRSRSRRDVRMRLGADRHRLRSETPNPGQTDSGTTSRRRFRQRFCWSTARVSLTRPEVTVLVGGLRAERELRQDHVRGVHERRDVGQRFLRQPSRHGYRVEAVEHG